VTLEITNLKQILFLCFGISCLTLSSCASPTTTPLIEKPLPEFSTQGLSKEPPITLEFWTLQLDAFQNVFLPMFQEYERQHPNIRIHWVDVPFSEGSKRTLTAMMSDHAPDVVNLNPDFSAVLASRNVLMDMNESVSPEVKRTYLPVAWDAASLQKPTESITFGLPWYITSSVTLYNKALLKKAGLSTIPTTWEAMPAFVRRIRQKAGVYGMMPTLCENGNFLKELQKIGVPLFNAKGRAVFATPKAIAHLARFVTLYRAGAFPAEALTESHQAAIARYQAGTLAMLAIGPNFLKIMKENAPTIYQVTDVSSQFPQNAPFKDFALMVLTVPRKSDHPKEAVEFAEFITNAQNQQALALAAPVLPSITSALSVSDETQSSQDIMSRARAMSANQLLQAKGHYRIQPNQNTVNQIIDYHVQMALLGKKKPADALKRAQLELNAGLE
jgi:putative chitobiose transport system substrate-binding protein